MLRFVTLDVNGNDLITCPKFEKMLKSNQLYGTNQEAKLAAQTGRGLLVIMIAETFQRLHPCFSGRTTWINSWKYCPTFVYLSRISKMAEAPVGNKFK